MNSIFKPKLYRNKPIKLNWFDLTFNWLSAKADITGNWMNHNQFVSSLVFFFVVFCVLILSLEV